MTPAKCFATHVCSLAVFIALLAAPATAQVLDFYDENAYRSIYLNFSQTNYWTLLTNNYATQVELPATMIVDGVTYPSVGVRFRGNTSYTQLPPGSQKKSFNIRTDSFVPGQDVLGYSNLNLNNGFHDPTFVREFLTYKIMRQYGPAPRCNFVKLYLNNIYWGVYINVQQPNKDWAGQWFRSNDGNRYRGFPESGTFGNGRCALTYLGTLPSAYLSAYQANQGDGTDLMLCCDLLNNTPQSNIETILPAIFSVDQFYRYAATMNILLQLDSYLQSGKDHYLYHDDVYGQFHMFPFDLNEAFGSAGGSTTTNMWQYTTDPYRPAFTKTINIPQWRNRYIAHYRNIADTSMNWATLGPIITQFQSMIAADVAADTKKIYTTAQFTQNITSTVTGPGGTIQGLQPIITGRDAYLATVPELVTPQATLASLAHSPLSPSAAQQVTFTVQASGPVSSVSLWRRSSGPFTKTAMFDDGLHGDGAAGDGIFGVIQGPYAPGTLIDYYAEAATAAGVVSYLPKTAEFKAPYFQVAWNTGVSPIKINEVLASNGSVIQDPAGEFDDCMELYNDSNAAVDVGGMYVTDTLLNPTKYMLPLGTTIPANGTLLIWCDENGQSQGPLHANFKFSASNGELAALFATDGSTLLDCIIFGVQTLDVSIGRMFDGVGTWVSYPTPSMGVRNELPGCGIRNYSHASVTNHTLQHDLVGSAAVGASMALTLTGALANAAGGLVITWAPDYVSVPSTNGVALVSLATNPLILPITMDGSGNFTLPVSLPNDPALAGLRVYTQGVAMGTSLLFSNALEITICP